MWRRIREWMPFASPNTTFSSLTMPFFRALWVRIMWRLSLRIQMNPLKDVILVPWWTPWLPSQQPRTPWLTPPLKRPKHWIAIHKPCQLNNNYLQDEYFSHGKTFNQTWCFNEPIIMGWTESTMNLEKRSKSFNSIRNVLQSLINGGNGQQEGLDLLSYCIEMATLW